MSSTSGAIRSINPVSMPWGAMSVSSEEVEWLDPYRLAGGHVAALLLEEDEAIGLGHRGEDARALRPGGPDLPALAGAREHAPLELATTDLLLHGLDRGCRKVRRKQLAPAPELPEG